MAGQTEAPGDAAPESGSSVYDDAYARFFERHYTGWVRDFSPDLEQYLAARCASPGRHLLDLCCGSGETLSVFLQAGWSVIGVDLSAAMLARAALKLAPALADGRARLQHGDAVALPAESSAADAVTSLDGALNHLLTEQDLRRTFDRVAAVLRPAGRFVFDLFEPVHFEHWNRLSLADEELVVMAKKGMWNNRTGRGRRRITGAFWEPAGWCRVAQDLTAQHFGPGQVRSLLRASGLQPVDPRLDMPACPCGAAQPRSCRTLFEAVRQPDAR